MKRLVLSLMVAATALLAGSAVADAYPPAQPPDISTDVPTVGPGGNFTATVGPCEPGEQVVITFQGVSQVVICDPSTLQASLALVAPMEPGIYEVCGELTGVGASVPPGVVRPQTVCTTIQVLAAPPTVPPAVPGGGLPATGSNGLGTTATSAIVLISAGALLLIVTQVRRRRSTPATA